MKGKMKGLIVEKDGSLAIREVSIPEYNDCQALVKTLSCGVCNGTDAKLIHRKFKNFGPELYPLMLGHEAVGEVVEIGSAVKTFKVGDRVLLPFAGPLDGYECGWGSFSEYGVVCDPASWDASKYGETPECAFGQTVLSPDVDPVKGAMIITLREVLSSIKRFGMTANKSVVVFGCGPVGLTFIKFLSLLGISPIVALDIVPQKLEDAKANGADYAFMSNDADVREKIKHIIASGADFVLDAVGISAIINTAMPLIKDQGKICCYGISPNLSYEIDWTDAPYNWQLQFQQFPSKVEEGEAHNQIMNWLRAGVINLDDYISDIIDFKDILTAFERLERRDIAKKCIIRY
ncbi:MAG: zinc-binding dehydrogenase [Clostridia bacterium]|nr:zinc-binding dehydrogenase [Clostridia bacterium]